MSKEGKLVRNDNGVRIVEISIDNKLIQANTKFAPKDIHNFTREERKRGEWSLIDCSLVNAQIWKEVKEVKVNQTLW